MVMRIEDQNIMLCKTEDSSSTEDHHRFGMDKNDETEDDEPWLDPIAKRKPMNRSMSVPEDCIVTGFPSVTELDKLHRQRREETERKEVSESGFSVHDALLSSKVTMIEDMDTHTTSSSNKNNHMNNNGGPKLRIRPQPFPSLHSLDESSTSMASPYIIPSTRDTNMLQPNHPSQMMMTFPHSFASPDSDQFVLHFPKGTTATTTQDGYQNDDLGLDYDDDPEVVNISNTNRNIPQPNNNNDNDNNSPTTSSSMYNNAIHNTTNTTNTTNNYNKQQLQKAGIIRKQPIRLKPKIASRHAERVPSLETKVFSSENLQKVTTTTNNNNNDNDVDDDFCENLSLPKIGNSEMRSRLDVIQPRPMRPSSENVYHQFGSDSMINRDRTLVGVVNRTTAITTQDDPNDSTPVLFGPISSRASSSQPQTDITINTTATPVDRESLVKKSLGSEQGRTEGKKQFSYASPPNVPNQLMMTSPPQMSIQKQLEMAKSAAARFSGYGSKETTTVTSSDGPNYRTPPSKFEHSSMMGYLCPGQIVPNRRIRNASNLFLPHLSNQDETSQSTSSRMVRQVTENQQIQPNTTQPNKQDESTLMDMGD